MPTLLLGCGLVFAVLTAISLWPPCRPGVVALAAWLPGWLVSELPVHHLIVHVAVAGWAVAGGALDAPAGWLGLALTAASAAGLVHHVRLARRATAALDGALDDALGRDRPGRGGAPARTPGRPGFWALAGVFPFRPRGVERVRDLVYARDGRRRLRLDVYRARDPDAPRRRARDADAPRRRAADPAARRPGAPVFLWIHGGAWVIGNKGQQGRLTLHRLAAAGWVGVAIDYRLSPRATFPDHLLDVKRAIRWVREHVAEYGGDPGFVVIGGGSAGAHLASLAALTPNVLEYQREFPEVDTSVQGCVAYYGVYDLADRDGCFRHRAFRDLLLERVVMKRRFRDAPEEFDRGSPRARVGAHAPPFLLVHGTCDSLAPLDGARRFRDALRACSTAPVAYAELPGAQHAFEIFPSLRAAAVILGVEAFCHAIAVGRAAPDIPDAPASQA